MIEQESNHSEEYGTCMEEIVLYKNLLNVHTGMFIDAIYVHLHVHSAVCVVSAHRISSHLTLVGFSAFS